MSEQENEVVEQTEGGEARLLLGLTPFGHIGINVTDSSGKNAGYVITSPDEASQTAMHLLTLSIMMIQSAYARRIEEQAAIAELAKSQGLWTPPS